LESDVTKLETLGGLKQIAFRGKAFCDVENALIWFPKLEIVFNHKCIRNFGNSLFEAGNLKI
jgi:hypothetical protein